MVIANDAVNFSVGANLMLVLVAAQEQEWDEMHMAVKQFQNANLAIKYAPKPVVAAPQGMALGGGCEVSLHAARIQAAAEVVYRISGGRSGIDSGRRRIERNVDSRE